MSNRSKTWDYFTKISGQTTAKCNKCGSLIQTKGGNTKAMINHLRSRHEISIDKCPEPEALISIESGDIVSAFCSKRPKHDDVNILKFIKRASRNELLAKCAAKDGFSFRAITHSEAIRSFILSKNYDMPKSEVTIKQCIMKFCEEKQAELKQKLIKKGINAKLSITVDEWTNNNYIRFINVTLHSPTWQHNLGLTKIDGSCNATETIRLIELTLNKYSLNLKTDIVASTHDGASVMVKYGNEIDSISQLCYNHAIHLAVVSIFYSVNSSQSNNRIEEFYEYDDEEDNESLDGTKYLSSDENMNFIVDYEEEIFELSVDISNIVNETRRICKFFKKSSVRNSILQKHVVEQHGKKLKLLLDCRTRWNSLIIMINRFILLSGPIYKALDELGAVVPSDDLISSLKEIAKILEPLGEAVRELSKREANLLIAEGTFMFVFNKLKKLVHLWLSEC